MSEGQGSVSLQGPFGTLRVAPRLRTAAVGQPLSAFLPLARHIPSAALGNILRARVDNLNRRRGESHTEPFAANHHFYRFSNLPEFRVLSSLSSF